MSGAFHAIYQHPARTALRQPAAPARTVQFVRHVGTQEDAASTGPAGLAVWS